MPLKKMEKIVRESEDFFFLLVGVEGSKRGYGVGREIVLSDLSLNE